MEFNKGTVLFIVTVLQTNFSRFFREKYIVRHVMEARESWTPCFFMSIPTIKYDHT